MPTGWTGRHAAAATHFITCSRVNFVSAVVWSAKSAAEPSVEHSLDSSLSLSDFGTRIGVDQRSQYQRLWNANLLIKGNQIGLTAPPRAKLGVSGKMGSAFGQKDGGRKMSRLAGGHPVFLPKRLFCRTRNSCSFVEFV